jgi:hypothetical protein
MFHIPGLDDDALDEGLDVLSLTGTVTDIGKGTDVIDCTGWGINDTATAPRGIAFTGLGNKVL